jgi:phosphatidylglycerol:prolipoprotein diacylglycerol transferase
MFAIWNGGLGIYGGIVGGIIGLYFYGRQQKQPILPWFDVIVPSLALGQAIGRWGNFINQELYGAPTNLPWAIYIEERFRSPGYKAFEYFHPLFLYESLWNFGTCLFLVWLQNRHKNSGGKLLRHGDSVLIYLMAYPLIRFLLDFVRLDSHRGFGPLTTAQNVSIVVFLVAGAALVLRRRLPARQGAMNNTEASNPS